MDLTASGRNLLNITVAFLVLAVVSTAARLASRVKLQLPISAADYVMTGACVVFTAYCGILFRALARTGTLDPTELTMQDPTMYTSLAYVSKLLFATEPPILVVILLSKISILLFLRSIFDVQHFRRLVLIPIGLVIAWFVGCLFVVIFQCSPRAGAWDVYVHLLPTTKCIPVGQWVAGVEASNILLDLIILTLPINEIRKLQMKLSRKLAVGCVFLLGSFVTITSVLRMALGYPPTNQSPLINFPLAMNWTTVQLSCAIICGNLPTLRPLLREPLRTLSELSRSWFSSVRSRSKSSSAAPSSKKNYYHVSDSSRSGVNSDYTSTQSAKKGGGLIHSTSTRAGPDSFDDGVPLNQINIRKDVTVERV